MSLPNGQQAFVLQVQDGALLSPFTMGAPFGDALALNPADWVVGDDLDAVVTRILDAYMPPRSSTPQEVCDLLPRRRVREAVPEATAGAGKLVSLRLEAHGTEVRVRLTPQHGGTSQAEATSEAAAPAAAPEAGEGATSSARGGLASCRAGEVCTVCHDAFEAGGEVVELPCRHCFHEGCIMPWLQQVLSAQVDAMTAAFFPAASELMPRMLWCMSLSTVSEAEGLLDTNPTRAAGSGAADMSALFRGFLPMAAAAPGGDSRSAASLLRNVPVRASDGVPDLPAMLDNVERSLVERLAQGPDAAGRARPTEEQLRNVQRRALRNAEMMMGSMALAMSSPSLMPRVAALADRWLQDAIQAVRRPPAGAAAGSAAGTATAVEPGTTGPQVGTARGRAADGTVPKGKGCEESGGDTEDERPTRQVARRSEGQDAASLAHHKDEASASPDAAGPAVSADVELRGKAAVAAEASIPFRL
ncbi:hypothetical protein GPECTOR_6g767 [Gonium pectorale]|uniref:RING-type domain-containing protein n=1 Tax=Gonium pectorale TaxID=33097 RepID=A0A150GVI0_GONPE|nr:hypothetical protein GPECTOR_6g767 [Gonium pectorale]|eukprot:KXZ53849.1 hypothetical protein GPECTOR_6g767 [Gonium pectorale]